uniref:Venom toxin n=1 Tax=Hemiscorpius lepturus TaxID=520031 RepID=A0A1L4BJ69_HEMLE|nr:venom toxin [Hemiscorpius lepturus]
MASKLCLNIVILFAIISSTMALSCRFCDSSQCPPPPTNCPVGTVRDVCGCCLVCAKAENEPCGGFPGIFGKCGKGLKCVYEPNVIVFHGICKKA